MTIVKALCQSVAEARKGVIQAASGLTTEQSQFKPGLEVWSVVDNVEHLVWAEMGGINGIWKALEGLKNSKPMWSGVPVHHGLSIEQIIDKTWQEKEQVPEVARPRWGGPVEYWIAALTGCQDLLESLERELDGYDPEKIIYPHIISGPLNVIQRMQFLRFHLDRHRQQIINLKNHPFFPK